MSAAIPTHLHRASCVPRELDGVRKKHYDAHRYGDDGHDPVISVQGERIPEPMETAFSETDLHPWLKRNLQSEGDRKSVV